MPSKAQLREAVRGLPIWGEVSRAYAAAVTDDFKKCLADLMAAGRAGRDAYRQCAEKAGLGAKLKAVWSE